jgi:hypothetical protein
MDGESFGVGFIGLVFLLGLVAYRKLAVDVLGGGLSGAMLGLVIIVIVSLVITPLFRQKSPHG